MADFACSEPELTEEWRRLSPVTKFEVEDALLGRKSVHKKTGDQSDEAFDDVFFFTDILGIDFDSPDLTLVDIEPIPEGLSWAKGSVTMPQGQLTVAWEQGDTRFTLDVTVPTGVHLRAILPAKRTDKLICDGEVIPRDSIVSRTNYEVELCVMPGAAYRFEVVRA